LTKDGVYCTIFILSGFHPDQFVVAIDIVGFPVVRMIDTASQGRKQLRLNTFCFKALAGERLPDEIEARGFMQRTIVLKCLPG
jgi:hypothetical protein